MLSFIVMHTKVISILMSGGEEVTNISSFLVMHTWNEVLGDAHQPRNSLCKKISPNAQ